MSSDLRILWITFLVGGEGGLGVSSISATFSERSASGSSEDELFHDSEKFRFCADKVFNFGFGLFSSIISSFVFF